MKLIKKIKRSSIVRKLKISDSRSKKTLFCASFLVLVSFMSIGFAYLSEHLETGASVQIANVDAVLIKKIDDNTTNGGVIYYNPIYTDNTATLSVDLPNLNSTVAYHINFKNYGNTVYNYKQYIEDTYSNEYIEYVVSHINTNDILAYGDETYATVTFKYKDGITTLPSDTTANLLINFEFEEYEIPTGEYANGNMILDLRGTDEPISNAWIDRVSGKAISLTNQVAYQANENRYDFSESGAAGEINETIIPTTGDFTLEVMIGTPVSLAAVSDQAIISQLSNTTSRDKGRIKLNLKDNGLLVFHSIYSSDTLLKPYFVDPIVADTRYMLQLVRSGNTLNLYLDGQPVSGQTNISFASTNKIAEGPFKLAKWQDSDAQSYNGRIYSIRVYNRSLTADELASNYTIDFVKYRKVYNSILAYAIEQHSSSDGGSLYTDNISNYVYRGNDPTNYLWIDANQDGIKASDDSETFRIINFNANGIMKVINTKRLDNPSENGLVAYDISGTRTTENGNGYCTGAETLASEIDPIYGQQYNGCNAWSKYLSPNTYTNGTNTGTVAVESSLNTHLNTTYYNSLNSYLKNKILKHDFAIGLGLSNKTRDQENIQSLTEVWNGYVGLLTLADVANASINSISIGNNNTSVGNYLTNLYSQNEVGWLMTAANMNTYDVFTILHGNSVGRKRASRYRQKSGNAYINMYANPTFYMDSHVEFSGVGTSDNPFVIAR